MAMKSNQSPIVEFYYDISCPFAYIASTRIEALAARANARVVWCPVLLGAIYEQTAAPQGAGGSATDTFNPTKRSVGSKAFARTLKRYQIPFNQPKKHPQRTPAALRLLYYLPNDERRALTEALFKAYWVDNKDISDVQVLLDIARRSGIASASKLSEAILNQAELHNALRTATADVVARGACGVPSFWIPEEGWKDLDGKACEGRLYWGQDRMHFVEAVLIGLNRGIDYKQVPDLNGLQPRCLWEPRGPQGKREILVEFWFDFSSPWAFLGWTQLKRIKRQAGNRFMVEMKPFLLGALFKEIGAPMLPMFAISAQKRAYMGKDQEDWIRHWNGVNSQQGSPDKPINFRFADVFPIRSPTLLRLAIVEPKLIPILYRACWEQNIDVANTEMLATYISKYGFDSADLLSRASHPKVRDYLRANTDQARAIGLCGAPTFRVLERTGNEDWAECGGIVWGQDELAVVEDLIAGWREEGSTILADVSNTHKLKKAKL